jgi:hypothetical protein
LHLALGPRFPARLPLHSRGAPRARESCPPGNDRYSLERDCVLAVGGVPTRPRRGAYQRVPAESVLRGGETWHQRGEGPPRRRTLP